jgi:hypothetical protein
MQSALVRSKTCLEEFRTIDLEKCTTADLLMMYMVMNVLLTELVGVAEGMSKVVELDNELLGDRQLDKP